jgi:hypothetical protein
MFREVPAADVYLFKHILHDWNDAECVQILSNMCLAASTHARALLPSSLCRDLTPRILRSSLMSI